MKITNITILMCVFVCCRCSYRSNNVHFSGIIHYLELLKKVHLDSDFISRILL